MKRESENEMFVEERLLSALGRIYWDWDDESRRGGEKIYGNAMHF